MTKARDIASAAPAPSTVSATEIGYLDGVSSAIQTQLDGKQAANANVSTTELGYLDGVTSAIQTQIDGKSSTSHNHNSDYIANTLTTTTGDIIYASSANNPARLGIGSTGQVLTVSGGVPSWATAASGGSSFSGCSLYGTDPGNFEISAGASTLITWNQELFDVGGYHSTSSNTDRITIPSGKAGYYLINAAIEWDDDNAVATCGIRVYLNGTEIARRYFIRSDNGGRTATDVQVTRNLAVNDYLQVYAYTETAQGAYHYSPQARFEVVFVGNA